MIRGTTPTLRFYLPFSVELLEVAYITMQQGGETVIEKTLSECTAEQNVISVKLTQEETLKLHVGSTVEIQIRAKTAKDDALASNIMRESADRILKEGVI